MAQVPRRLATTDQTDESDYHVYSSVICRPCVQDGKQSPAVSYCEDCRDYLCVLCCNDHKKFKVLSRHTLTDITGAPIITHTKQRTEPTLNCNVHTDKLIEFFCSAHTQILCGICAVTKHTSCKPDYIPDISMDFTESDQYNEIKAKLEALLYHVSQSSKCAKDNVMITEKSQARLLAELEQYGDELVRYIEQAVKKLKDEAKKLYDDHMQNLRKVKDDLDSYENEIRETKTYLRKLEEQSSNLFITCQREMTRFEELQNQINDTNSDNIILTYLLERSTVSKELISTERAVGVLVKDQHLQQITQSVLFGKHHSQKINWETCQVAKQPELTATFTSDKLDCHVTSLVLLGSNSLLISDFANCCLKQISTDTSAMIDYLPLPGQPWDLTVLPNDRAAVTIPLEKKIHFITTKEKLAILHHTKVRGRCHGICTTADGRLVVSYDKPAKVEVLDDRSTVLSTIRTDDGGKALFSEPFFVCVATENNQEIIFISDFSRSILSKVTMSGQVLSKYCDQTLQGYYGITAADGHLLICGIISHNVHVVSTNMKNVRTLLTGRDLTRHQSSACFDSERKTVYVGCFEGNIKVYRLEECSPALTNVM